MSVRSHINQGGYQLVLPFFSEEKQKHKQRSLSHRGIKWDKYCYNLSHNNDT